MNLTLQYSCGHLKVRPALQLRHSPCVCSISSTGSPLYITRLNTACTIILYICIQYSFVVLHYLQPLELLHVSLHILYIWLPICAPTTFHCGGQRIRGHL